MATNRRKEQTRDPLIDLGLEALDCLFDDLVIAKKEFPLERLTHEGFAFLTDTLPALGRALDEGLKSGHFILPSSFKHKLGCRKLPQCMGSLFSTIFDNNGFLLDVPNIESVRALRQVLFYFYKTEIACSVEKEERVIEKFLKDEYEGIAENALITHYSKINRRTQFHDILSEAKREIYRIFGDYNRSTKHTLNFNHGPGSVADASIEAKDQTPIPYSLAEYWGSCLLGSDDFESISHKQVASARNTRLELESRVFKVKLVPKDSRGPRLIAVEPTWNQYLQQGLRNWIYTRVESSSMGQHVHFTDQSRNRAQALIASLTKTLATLDLSRASDRNFLALVRELWSLVPDLLEDVLHCRSEFYSIDGVIRGRYEKFAPMGSALCFPFLAISLYTLILGWWRVNGGDRDSLVLDIVGDDIIVESKYAYPIINVLTNFGFIVNEDKSCVNSAFAESCGVDAFNGVDVTPLKLSEVPHYESKFESAAKIVAHANLLRERGLRAISALWFEQAERLLGFHIPYGHKHSPFICRFTDDNWIKLNRASREAGLKMRYYRCVSENRKRRSTVVSLVRESIQSAKSFIGFVHKAVRGDCYHIDPDIPGRVDVKRIDIPRRLIPVFMSNKQVESIY